MSHIELSRRFVERENYDPDELIAVEITGKRIGWDKLLESHISVIIAPANFGKTTEMTHRARQMRASSQKAIFVALRRIADRGTFERALDVEELQAYKEWLARPTSSLTIFVDSLDEAAAGRKEGIEYLIGDVANEISWPNEHVKWVISTRPATLTPHVINKLTDLLVKPIITSHAKTKTKSTTKRIEVASATSTTESSGTQKLRIFSMASLDVKQAKDYLESIYPTLPAIQLLELANRRGLSGYTRNPGGLEILARCDLLSHPPESLTEVYNRVVSAIQTLRAADPRIEDAGKPPIAMLDEAVEKLASASQVCQIVNVEMPQEILASSEKALSARRLIAPMLTERAIEQLLNSQLFIDVGFYQVKMFPDELGAFLGARRISQLINSPDQALRLMQNFCWSAPSGEQGIHPEYLPLMGWLATFNTHCRAIILQSDPQALAFFGDLRNDAVPLGDAKTALSESLRRLVHMGDHPGRQRFTLTSENYWQAGPDRLAVLISDLFKEYEHHHWASDVLVDIARTCNLDVLRGTILRKHKKNYLAILEDSHIVRYLLDLNKAEDAAAIAKAIMEYQDASDSLVSMIIESLAWKYLKPANIIQLIDNIFNGRNDGFAIQYLFESSDFLGLASYDELYQLGRGLVLRSSAICKHQNKLNRGFRKHEQRFAELTTEVMARLVGHSNDSKCERITLLCLILQRTLSDSHYWYADYGSLRRALEENHHLRISFLAHIAKQSTLSDHELLITVISQRGICSFSEDDIKKARIKRLSKIYNAHLARVRSLPLAPAEPTPKSEERPLHKISSRNKSQLRKLITAIADGTEKSALEWVARWLLQTNPSSRYGEVNFDLFEAEAGKGIADAVRSGFSLLWRNNPPKFDEGDPRSTYHITVAGLQGLSLEFDNQEIPISLSSDEVRRALRYATFEINGYPKWFWKLVQRYPKVSESELLSIAKDEGKGQASREHAETLLTALDEAPPSIRETLSPIAWQYLLDNDNSREYVAEKILESIKIISTRKLQTEFRATTTKRMKAAFDSSSTTYDIEEPTPPQMEAAMWGCHLLAHFPSKFMETASIWRNKDPIGADAFFAQMAVFFGRNRTGALVILAQSGNAGLLALEQLYHWTIKAVPPSKDIKRGSGVYTPRNRDHASDFRNRILPIIAEKNSQTAYEVLGRLHDSSSAPRNLYIRRLQFELRERQFTRPPLPQSKYNEFENDFTFSITELMSFSMLVHSNLEGLKYDIEFGEHSLRRFFNSVDFKRINLPGVKGERAGLALEIDFQSLLASELNHHSIRRYSITIESQTAEAKRRDVLCSLGDWRASIELKMSERWTVIDYINALEKQLVGQYMRHRAATTGFLVVVLQRRRRWVYDGKRLGFDDVILLLQKKAQAIESRNGSLYLRVIGIDATAPQDFRNMKSVKVPGRSRTK